MMVMLVARAWKFIHASSFVFHSVNLCQLHAPTYFVFAEAVFVVFHIILTMAIFVGSQSFISPPCFVFVSAAVSEICKLNLNEENNSFENGSFQFNPIPGHIIFSLELLLAISKSVVHHELKVIIGISLVTHNPPGPSLYTQYCRTACVIVYYCIICFVFFLRTQNNIS